MLRTANTMLICVLSSMLLISTMAWANTAAGTRIQNQASAVYKFEGDETVRTATSNLVTTVIQQVASVDLTQGSSKFAANGFEVFFPHVLTNTGNGVDEFTLSVSNVTGDDFDLRDIALYADANHDGQPDNLNIPLTEKVPLAQGESFYFIASGRVPVSAGQKAVLIVKATSQFTSTLKVEQENTVEITDKAVVQVTQAISHSNDASPSSSGYEVTLTYQNRSNASATDITIIDSLPTGMIYEKNSATWSVISGSLNDTGSQTYNNITINFCAYDAACSDRLMAKISKLDANSSASISFKFKIDRNLAASILKSTAQFNYHNGEKVTKEESTNTVPFEVLQSYGVVINGSGEIDSGKDAGEPVIYQEVVAQGGSIAFENYVWNRGNGKDTFDLSIDKIGTTFPAGTFFQFLSSDGESPLMDTNGNGIVDTGVVEKGQFRKIYVRVMLPSNIHGGNGYTLKVLATSKIGNNVQDSIENKLTTIQESEVDLTSDQVRNGDGSAPGEGSGLGEEAEPNPVTTLPVMTGGTGTFLLYVNNTSGRADRYLLSHSATSNFAPITALPAGWKVNFYFDGGENDCKTLGNLTYTSGLINTGQNRLICAVVSASKAVMASDEPQSIYFRVSSATTGATDVIHNAVNIGANYLLIIRPDQFGQTQVGSSIVYSHIVKNYSNTSLSDINIISTNELEGWSNIVYVDSDGNAQLDPTDRLFKNEKLDMGESLIIFVKVFVPTTAKIGMENTTSLTIQGVNSQMEVVEGSSVVDVTQLSANSVVIIKEQALDTGCNGAPDGPNSCSNDACFTAATFSVSQGQCVIYRLTATNNSTKAVENVQINDVVPDFTSYYTKNGYPYPSTTHGGIINEDGNIVAGAIDGSSVTLNAGESMVLKFAVRLD